MRYPRLMMVALSLQVLWLCATGCSKNVTAPPPLPADQLPAAMQKAFSKAKPEIKEVADQVVASLQATDYAKAFAGMQKLGGQSGLNKEQIDVITRGSLTLNGLLQAAQTQGDQKAAETLKTYRINK